MTKILAVIPVKMNSMRFNQKNIKKINGHPMFLWTYAAAKTCKYITKIIISSESKKVLNIAKRYGYEDNYTRPKKLTHDKYTNSHVVYDVLKNQSRLGFNYDHVMLLQPTSPIREKNSLTNFIKNYLKSNCKSGLSIKGPIYKKYDFLGLLKKNRFIALDKNLKNKKLYSPSASIYISNVKDFLNKKKFFINPIYSFLINTFETTDIDYKNDFKIAELILKNRLVKVNLPKKIKI